jgi:hypothetical protein
MRLTPKDRGTLGFEIRVPEGDASRIPSRWLGTSFPIRGTASIDLHADVERLFDPKGRDIRGGGSLELVDSELALMPMIGGLDRYMMLSPQTVFDRVSTGFNFTDEGIILREGVAEGDFLRLEIARPSSIRYDRTLDMEILVKRSEGEETHFPVFTKLTETMKEMFLKPFKNVLTLRIQVKGNLDRPEFSLVRHRRGS